MRHFYLQIYLGIVGIVLLLVLLSVALWDFVPIEDAEDRFGLEAMQGLAQSLAPPHDAHADALREAMEPIVAEVDIELSIYDADGQLLLHWGAPLPIPDPELGESHWSHPSSLRRTFAVRHEDGRWFVGRPTQVLADGDFVFVVVLVILLGVSIGAYPFARRLTRRLDRLRDEVETLGAGDLKARVKVEGKDAIADLAHSFNRTAETIERLVDGQRRTLAAASHELRSPLARLQLAVELMQDSDRPELLDGARRDLAELDGLIGEILLASKLENSNWKGPVEEVDLLGLLAEESARVGLEPAGDPVVLRVEAGLVRRLIRNLLENALRYGGNQVEAAIRPGPALDAATLVVADRGPGVPEQDRERIFEPFFRSDGWAEAQGGGVGLGLALVRQIAERHGGEARCERRDGGGLQFVVTLYGRPSSVQSGFA